MGNNVKNPVWAAISEESKRLMMEQNGAIKYLNTKCLTENSYASHFIEIHESRGRVEGTDSLVTAIVTFINSSIKHGLEGSHIGSDAGQKADIYEFDVPSNVFDNVDTAFLYKPQFHIRIVKVHTLRPNFRQFIGSNYLADGINPATITISGVKKLAYPSFEITFIANDEWYYEEWIVRSIINHELTHAKLNFEEFQNGQNKQRTKKYQNKVDFLNASDGSIEYKVTKLWSYMCDADEMNARANQIYDELERLNTNYRIGFNLKRLLPMCPTYEIATDQYDDLKDTLEAHIDDKWLEAKMRGYLNDKSITIQSMLSTLKQCRIYQEKQFCKVAEYWLYKKLTVKV